MKPASSCASQAFVLGPKCFLCILNRLRQLGWENGERERAALAQAACCPCGYKLTALRFAFDYKVPFAFAYKLPGFYHCELLYISQNALENTEGRVKRKRHEHTFPYYTFAVERQIGY